MTEQSQQQAKGKARGAVRAALPRPLVGREQAMAHLRSAVTACADGTSTVIEITGDPGLGKTRMLSELGDLARAEGLAVLSALEFEQQRSFGVFAAPIRGCFGRSPARLHPGPGGQRPGALAGGPARSRNRSAGRGLPHRP